MNKDQYFDLLEQAVANFRATLSDELDGENVQAQNDEFMLELYSVTGDGRAP